MTTKLEDSNAAPKTYWAILNCFLYNKKILAIPPLPYNCFLSNKLFIPSESGLYSRRLMCCPGTISNTWNTNSFWWQPYYWCEWCFSWHFQSICKIWYDSFTLKLVSYGVDGELLSLLKNYFQNTEQRVVLNGQTLKGRKINPGVSVSESRLDQ